MDVYLKHSEILRLTTAELEDMRLPSGPDANRPAFLAIGFGTARFQALSQVFGARGTVIIRSDRLIDVRSRFWFSGLWQLHEISQLLVDVAGLGGVARCRQDLRRIRDLMPHLPFVLVDAGPFDAASPWQRPASHLLSRKAFSRRPSCAPLGQGAEIL